MPVLLHLRIQISQFHSHISNIRHGLPGNSCLTSCLWSLKGQSSVKCLVLWEKALSSNMFQSVMNPVNEGFLWWLPCAEGNFLSLDSPKTDRSERCLASLSRLCLGVYGNRATTNVWLLSPEQISYLPTFPKAPMFSSWPVCLRFALLKFPKQTKRGHMFFVSAWDKHNLFVYIQSNLIRCNGRCFQLSGSSNCLTCVSLLVSPQTLFWLKLFKILTHPWWLSCLLHVFCISQIDEKLFFPSWESVFSFYTIKTRRTTSNECCSCSSDSSQRLACGSHVQFLKFVLRLQIFRLHQQNTCPFICLRFSWSETSAKPLFCSLTRAIMLSLNTFKIAMPTLDV